ncbi:MAG: heavy-metal-associated domain-containing protein [Chitinophagaceae bacterium]|nr:heavy-metal-associated domain-containing protein [Chitinophagaceae bacterium]
MKRIILILVVALYGLSVQAQFSSARLQASGLTCSLCSKAIFKALTTIPFVDKVEADVATSGFDIAFKEGGNVDVDQLKKAVIDAGFSVAGLKIQAKLEEVAVKNDAHLTIQGKIFHFMNVKPQTVKGNIELTILDKNFVPAKDFKKNAQYTKMKCYTTGVMEACCNKTASSVGTRVYHVTL